MKGAPLPPSDHVSRWCKASHVEDGIVGASAFMLEEKDSDDGLSVNWLELLGHSRGDQISAVQGIFASRRSRISPNARIAVLTVNSIPEVAKEVDNWRGFLTVIHSPTTDQSHSSILGLPRDHYAAALAKSLLGKIIEVHPAAH